MAAKKPTPKIEPKETPPARPSSIAATAPVLANVPGEIRDVVMVRSGNEKYDLVEVRLGVLEVIKTIESNISLPVVRAAATTWRERNRLKSNKDF